MPRVPIQQLRPGWHLAGNIYNHNGLVLLTAGTRLTSSYIKRLRELGIRAVDIQIARFADLTPREIISPELRSRSAVAVARTLDAARRTGRLDPTPVIPLVDNIVDQVFKNQGVTLGLTDIRAHDAYTHAHSVNVCMLATLIGRSLRYPRAWLVDLGIGAILHDLGKVFIEHELLTRQAPLTEAEFDKIKKHTTLGSEAIAASHGLPRPAALIAMQHHERLDGSGYPDGLHDEQISTYAKIVAVADVYDALSSDRPYRPALPPKDCVELLTVVENGKYWGQAVQALVTRVSPYPEGCTVILETGELAMVTRCLSTAPDRPEIEVFADASGKPFVRTVPLRLVDLPNVKIKDIASMESLHSTLDHGHPSTAALSPELYQPNSSGR